VIQNKKYEAIVIGTSIGGLHAISTLLEEIPANYPLPIIIVQHRSKTPRDLLEEILQIKTKVKVKQADEKEEIENGVVYIAPPDYHLLIENNKTFSLTVDELDSFSRPSINVLFESAASVYKEKLIGIILTGANNDGSQGVQSIYKNNGLVIVQDPDEAKEVNHILTLPKIQKFLLKITD
jgi:two-component system chemotaxis response regulator CheB